jgi:hypothetical protein
MSAGVDGGEDDLLYGAVVTTMLDDRFHDLYAHLNPEAASLARRNKISRLESSR